MIPIDLPGSPPGLFLINTRWTDKLLIFILSRINCINVFINKAFAPISRLIYYPVYASPIIRAFFHSFLNTLIPRVPDSLFLFSTIKNNNLFLPVKSSFAFPVPLLIRLPFLIPYVQYGIYSDKWPAVTNGFIHLKIK